MIEMLGVLAIVGVLSIGALAGYTKLNHMYKSHRQIQQLNTIFEAVYGNYDAIQAETDDYTNIVSALIKLKAIPQDMVKKSSGRFYDVWGSEYYIEANKKNADNWIRMVGGHLSKEQQLTPCENVFKVAQIWSKKIISISSYASGYGNITTYYGDDECYGSRKCLKNLKPADFDGICDVCPKDAAYCTFIIHLGYTKRNYR